MVSPIPICVQFHLCKEELNKIVMEIDIDGSGTIDFLEFVHLMKERNRQKDGLTKERILSPGQSQVW